MKKAACLSALLALAPSAASAGNIYFYSKLDLPLYTYPRQARRPTEIDKLYIGSDRSYAAEPLEIVVAGKSLTAGMAAAGALKASDPFATAGFLLIGLISTRDLSRALKEPHPRSSWSFIWSRNKR